MNDDLDALRERVRIIERHLDEQGRNPLIPRSWLRDTEAALEAAAAALAEAEADAP